MEQVFEFEFIVILQRLQIRRDASFHLAVNIKNKIITYVQQKNIRVTINF